MTGERLTSVIGIRSCCDGPSDRSFMMDSLHICRSNQCSTAGARNTVVCAILSNSSKVCVRARVRVCT